LLNFGAVDYEATIFVNGQKAGTHTGGYFEFSIDVTEYLNANGTNEL
jgi:beta-galactosidase/beta-glucuronidase